jgi:glycosyltransferase involved in cell wall biosynthesis
VQLPTVTLAVFGFRQEHCISAAVRAAFAQVGAPVEIILSDDCSPDQTFDVMRRLAHGYRGPHTIRLNRNERRLGIGGHVNRVMEMSSGELIIVAAGDDVSAPHRAQALVNLWSTTRPDSSLLCSGLVDMEFDGTLLGSRAGYPSMERDPVQVALRGRWIAGCTAAWTRRLWERFGPLPTEAVHEDEIMTLRAALAGSILVTEEPLVCYRAPGPRKFSQADLTCPDRRTEAGLIESLLRSTEIQLASVIAAENPAIRYALLRRARALRLLASIENGQGLERLALAATLADRAWAARIVKALAGRNPFFRPALTLARRFRHPRVTPGRIPEWAWQVER